jgi:hypothetical protein
MFGYTGNAHDEMSYERPLVNGGVRPLWRNLKDLDDVTKLSVVLWLSVVKYFIGKK